MAAAIFIRKQDETDGMAIFRWGTTGRVIPGRKELNEVSPRAAQLFLEALCGPWHRKESAQPCCPAESKRTTGAEDNQSTQKTVDRVSRMS